MSRVTSENITELAANEVFVFGSNTAGRHGAGAARAARKWGAVYGVGEGLQGQTYAIPTVNASVTEALPLDDIQRYVERFTDFASNHPELTFLVTAVGCGLAGWDADDIAPLFVEASKLPNIKLPLRFWSILRQN